MTEIMPFGKHKGKSVEQIAINNYAYFTYVLRHIPIQKRSLRERFEYVHYVANNFESRFICGNNLCDDPSTIMSVYHGYDRSRMVSPDFLYCSKPCWDTDSKVTPERGKLSLENLGFDSALSYYSHDTDQILRVVKAAMGIKTSRKTKEYLEDFFDNCPIRTKTDYAR